MKVIAHRGNTKGPQPEKENSLLHITDAIRKGFDVEIDIWMYENNIVFFGHDFPQYETDLDVVKSLKTKAWFHCKNVEAMYYFSNSTEYYKYFWHQNDDFTLTSNNYIWTYPGRPLTPYSISVMPELNEFRDIGGEIYGVCTDYAEKVSKSLKAISE
jgi:hypothetical protein